MVTFTKIDMYGNGRFLFMWGGGGMLMLHKNRRIKVLNGLVSKRELVMGKLISDHPSPFCSFVGSVEV